MNRLNAMKLTDTPASISSAAISMPIRVLRVTSTVNAQAEKHGADNQVGVEIIVES